jgi:hypothetical protein
VTTPNDTTSEPLWIVTRRDVGDVALRWEDLTDAEREDAIRHHHKI